MTATKLFSKSLRSPFEYEVLFSIWEPVWINFTTRLRKVIASWEIEMERNGEWLARDIQGRDCESRSFCKFRSTVLFNLFCVGQFCSISGNPIWLVPFQKIQKRKSNNYDGKPNKKILITSNENKKSTTLSLESWRYAIRSVIGWLVEWHRMVKCVKTRFNCFGLLCLALAERAREQNRREKKSRRGEEERKEGERKEEWREERKERKDK